MRTLGPRGVVHVHVTKYLTAIVLCAGALARLQAQSPPDLTGV